jgi:hypothetical protein
MREALEALAVHHEHRERDLTRARTLAMRALHAEDDARRRAAVTHRLDRLDRKLGRTREDTQPSLLVRDGAGPECPAGGNGADQA